MKQTQDIIFEPRKKINHHPDNKIKYDLAVIGAGIAGFSAAMYAARLGMKTVVIGEMEGGTINLTGPIENYPGFVSITGHKLAELMKNHAMDYEVHFLTAIAERLEKRKKIFSIHTDSGNFLAKTVLLATGTTQNKLGILGENTFIGNGVSYCALCDLTQTKGKVSAVIGGGDSAVKEAILISEYAKKVYIINNEEKLHAETHNMKNLMPLINKGKIVIMNNTSTTEIIGNKRVEGIIFKDKKGIFKKLVLSWVFIYVGSRANSKLANEVGAKINKNGEVIIDKDSKTNILGFFAAGDVTDTDWKQAIIAAAQGVSAAYHSYKYVQKTK